MARKNTAAAEVEAETSEAGTAEKAKRPRKTESTYLNASGEPTKNAKEAQGVRITVVGAGTEEIRFDQLSEEIRNAALAFGLKLKGTNGIGGADKGPEDAFEDLATIYENLRNGEWSERSGGGDQGPRTSMLAEAILAAYHAAGKTHLTMDDVKKTMADKDEAWRKDAVKNPAVKAQYERLRAEAAAERARKAGAAVGDAVGDLPGGL